MVFNSAIFLYFFGIVLPLYWGLGRLRDGHRWQNRFLLLASYFFYGWWDWLFLVLLFISTSMDYTLGRLIEARQDERARLRLVAISVVLNLGLLSIFKYYDFFIDSLITSARVFDAQAFSGSESYLLLNVILPVGISFYTFQSMAYTIDVYRRQIPAEKNLFDFALFVTFFPQLVAGPIERAGDLMPQVKAPRKFQLDDLAVGAWFMLFGFFMKTYVADSIAPLVNQVYLDNKAVYTANPALAAGHGGAQVFLASVGFAFQIFGDFAGYSTIALGCARMMGFRLTINFDTPEFSQNPAELWRRWHTTLNRWVTDYVYISMGGSRHGSFRKYRNLFLAFLLTGLWHGANWTFVAWGGFMGAWIIGYDLTRKSLPVMPETWNPRLRAGVRALKMVAVFTTFGVSATFFRAYDITHSLELWKSLFALPWDLSNEVRGVMAAGPMLIALLQKIVVLVALDAMWYRSGDPAWIHQRPVWQRVLVYSILFYFVTMFGVFGKEVIYFAF